MGGDVSSFQNLVTGWKSQAGLLANYESHGFGGLYQEAMIPICHYLLGLQMRNEEEFINYLDQCRRSNGSFNNAPASFGGDGNILNTYWSLYALQTLSAPDKLRSETIKWIQDCQRDNGGFTHQPNPGIGNNDDVIYTWAGIKALKILGAKPLDEKKVVRYLTSLHNADGGFGSRPGLHSTALASFYAVDALKDLEMLPALDNLKASEEEPEAKTDFSGYQIYSVQFQAHGQGSPKEAVMLADSLKIDLWGVKNPIEGWIAEAREIAKMNNVPVTFFISDEPYDKQVTIPGMGAFNHILDYIAPADAEIQFAGDPTFEELGNTTLKQLKEVNGGLVLQVSNNEPLARMLIDESINNRHGYLALSTVHFGQNFMFWLPYVAEYRYRLPLVTLQDAHGPEPWIWTDELTHHRNLFIARSPTYEGMIEAMKKNWIVGVRHDSVTNFKTRLLGGAESARQYIIERESGWKWWDNAGELKRPRVAITVLTSDDKFEAGKPDKFLNIRVRVQWNSTRETLKSPAFVLEELKVDGQEVKAELVIVSRANRIIDSYYLYHWTNPVKGTREIEAKVRQVSTNKILTYSTFYQYR